MSKKFLQIAILGILIIGLLVSVVLVRQQQNIKKQAAGAGVSLSLQPSQHVFPNTTDTLDMQLMATFTGAVAGEKLDGFQTEIVFNKDHFAVSAPIRTASSGFDTIIRVDTPEFANEQGKIKIVLVAGTPGSGPDISGSKTITMATVVLKALPNAPKAIPADNPANITITQAQTEIVNNQAQDLTIGTVHGAKYTLALGDVIVTNTPPVSPTPTLSPNVIKVGSITFRAKTGVTGDARIDFSEIKESFVTEAGGTDILGTISGLIIKILGVGGVTPTPDPNAPKISFKVKFRSVSDQSGDSNPNQKVILRAKGNGIFKEYTNIPVTHTGDGVYAATNVNLSGVTSLDVVTFFVKGPKHLAKEVGAGSDVSDWTATELEGGDTIPQDGVVNSVDISRILELLSVANQSQQQLNVGDLNYDGIVNGADVNELILTLSTKRDED